VCSSDLGKSFHVGGKSFHVGGKEAVQKSTD
jgi:hypothetical protein